MDIYVPICVCHSFILNYIKYTMCIKITVSAVPSKANVVLLIFFSHQFRSSFRSDLSLARSLTNASNFHKYICNLLFPIRDRSLAFIMITSVWIFRFELAVEHQCQNKFSVHYSVNSKARLMHYYGASFSAVQLEVASSYT